MKILWMGGDHPRHLFYLNAIHKIFPVSGAIIERRGGGTNNLSPEPPQNISEHDKKNFLKHFENRNKAEIKFFGIQNIPDTLSLKITKEELNTKTTVDFIQSINPDLVLLFGCHLVMEPLFSKLPAHTINLHGGLSPRYRGTATMFWPFYFLEPNHVGATFHYILSEPDAGTIIHQSIPKLEYGDTIHDVACKTILSATNDMIELLKIFQMKGEWLTFKQKGTGKNFLERDFRPEHLRVIYDLFNDKIVDYFLDSDIKSSPPNLTRQF